MAGEAGSSPMATRPLQIAPHVFVCVTSDGSVLLDLKRDKYLGLGRDETELVASAVAEWPKPVWEVSGRESRADQDAVKQLLRSLIDAGVLTRQAANNVTAGRRAVVDMRVDWTSIGDELEVESRVTVSNAVNFVKALAEARLSLTLRPFAATVESARLRKLEGERNLGGFNVLQVAGIVDAFRRLRPFVFAAEGRCLLHALTLVNFLAKYDFYPEWVIGVSTQPWGAHSWVQWGNYLLDTNPEKVCHFTPILVV
jgi:Transglutaminase-like superfamily